MDNYQPTSHLAAFPHNDGSRVPYPVFNSAEIYAREQERIYQGPTWNFLGLEAEILRPGDYKATFIGDTPVVMTRAEDGTLAAWVNRCAHRGAMVCRLPRGNALIHSCVYHQWSFGTKGNLQGVPFRRGQANATGMPADFDPKQHNLRQLRVDSYQGLVFATFDDRMVGLADYIGPEMRPYVDRIFSKPIVYLGCTRQFSDSNWKLYLENVKDPYHASLLHLFHTTFNILRVGMKARCVPDAAHGLHSVISVFKNQDEDSTGDYKNQQIRSYDEGFKLEDDSILALHQEYADITTNHIQPIFPQLVIQQIHNTLVARQLLPKGPDHFELIFHFFGYADDTPEMRKLRIKQANLVGPAGYISMEDTEATELIQRGIVGSDHETAVIDMSRAAPDEQATLITESLIRRFWVGYQKLMGSTRPLWPPSSIGMEDLMLRLELSALQERYVAVLDNDRIEEWPGFFTDDCLYEIVSKENEDQGLPAPVIHCDNVRMLRDRVLALRNANIYEKPQYRHALSGMEFQPQADGSITLQTSYIVVNTSQAGETTIYQAGRYLDHVVRTPQGLRFQSKRCIYDTLRVQTVLAFPI